MKQWKPGALIQFHDVASKIWHTYVTKCNLKITGKVLLFINLKGKNLVTILLGEVGVHQIQLFYSFYGRWHALGNMKYFN